MIVKIYCTIIRLIIALERALLALVLCDVPRCDFFQRSAPLWVLIETFHCANKNMREAIAFKSHLDVFLNGALARLFMVVESVKEQSLSLIAIIFLSFQLEARSLYGHGSRAPAKRGGLSAAKHYCANYSVVKRLRLASKHIKSVLRATCCVLCMQEAEEAAGPRNFFSRRQLAD
jgi:hypothetical protein